MDDLKRIAIIGTGHTQRALEALMLQEEELMKRGANVTTAQLGEGETNDAFFEQIASLNGVDYAEVERRFMALDPRAFMREVPPDIDLYKDGLELKKIAGNYGVVTVDELEPDESPRPRGVNRKQRRAQAARARDKRWRIKL